MKAIPYRHIKVDSLASAGGRNGIWHMESECSRRRNVGGQADRHVSLYSLNVITYHVNKLNVN